MLSAQYFEGTQVLQRQPEIQVGKKLYQIYDTEQKSRLSCFSLLLAASAPNTSRAEIFPSLLALDSQICLG